MISSLPAGAIRRIPARR